MFARIESHKLAITYNVTLNVCLLKMYMDFISQMLTGVHEVVN